MFSIGGYQYVGQLDLYVLEGVLTLMTRAADDPAQFLLSQINLAVSGRQGQVVA
jgi:hypothetical protein